MTNVQALSHNQQKHGALALVERLNKCKRPRNLKRNSWGAGMVRLCIPITDSGYSVAEERSKLLEQFQAASRKLYSTECIRAQSVSRLGQISTAAPRQPCPDAAPRSAAKVKAVQEEQNAKKRERTRAHAAP